MHYSSNNSNGDLPYLHALHCILAHRLLLLHRLLRAFKSAQLVWEADLLTLQHATRRKETAEYIIDQRSSFSVSAAWKKFLDLQQQYGIELVQLTNKNYPPLLTSIDQPPHLLYCRGNLTLLQHSTLLSIVGARKATAYGKTVITESMAELVNAGVITVSGLAFGIDAHVHTETIHAGGKTIAVLGSSVLPQEIAPTSNSRLAEDIIESGGLLISEYPPHTGVRAHLFPERNRIIAGLSPATLVVEATQKSGSLITAKFARDTGREVFAVPGSIYSEFSEGTNALITQGATPWLSCLSLFDTLEYQIRVPKHSTESYVIALSQSEHTIVALCEQEPLSIDTIIERSGLPTPECIAILSSLLLRNILTDMGNNTFKKR